MSAPESTGWVKVHRSVWGTDVFAGDAMSRREAWLWLVSAVAFTDTEDVGRGQIRTSLGGLAEVFGWDRARVQRWLQSLAGAGMIADVADGSGRLIEVSKYSEFQAASAPVAETQDQAARYTPRYTPRCTTTPAMARAGEVSQTVADTPPDTHAAPPAENSISRAHAPAALSGQIKNREEGLGVREGAHARGQNSEPLKPPAKPAPTPVNRFADGSVRSVGRGGGVILVRLPCANQVVPWLKAQRFRFNPADRTWSAPDSPELAAAVAAIMPARSFGRGWSPEQPKQVNLFGAKVVELRQPAGTSATPAPKPAPSPLPPREQDEEARAILELVEAQISNPSLFDRVFGSVTSAHVAGGVLGLTFANEVGQLVARATFTPLVTACASAVLGQLNARVEFHYAEPAAAQRSA